MTFTVDRQTFPDGIGNWDIAGDGSVDVHGDYIGTSVAEALQVRENLRWLEGKIAAVSWSEDATKDGFYRVAAVDTEDTEVTLTTGLFSWSMTLEPLPHHRALEIEATCQAVGFTDAPSADTPWYAVPNEAVAVNYGTGSIATDTRTGPGGTALVMTGTAFDDRYARWTVAPADALNMAPRAQFDGVTVIGLQSTLDPFDVTLDNGIVKVGMATGSDTFIFTLPASTNSNWGTPFGVDVGWFDGVSSYTWLDPDDCYAARITRYAAECVAVRWSFETSGLITHVDVMLRRGAVLAEIVMSQEGAYTDRQWAISQAATTTVYTSRASRSSAIEGNYYFMVSLAAATKDGSVLYINSATDQARFGMGVILEGASATAENDEASVRDQFSSAQMITERYSGVRQ